jgi:YD repeat-containing protein
LNTTYTNLGLPELTTMVGSSEYVDWTYDSLGRLTTLENQDVTLSYTYLAGSSRIATETTVVKGLGNLSRSTTRLYDSAARPTGFSRAGVFQLSFSYGNHGLIDAVTNDSPPPLAVYSYDASGQPALLAHENGLSTSWSRDSAGRVTAVTTGGSLGVVSAVGHTYDAASRRTSATYEDTLGQAYAYDAAGQLTHARVGIAQASQADATVTPTHTYAYDPAGNPTQTMDFDQAVNYTAINVTAHTALTGGGYAPPAPSEDALGRLTLN